jgi:hypothetical protein
VSWTFVIVFPTGSAVRWMSLPPATPGATTTSTQTWGDFRVIEIGAVCTDRAGAAFTSSAVIDSTTTAMTTSANTDLRSRRTSVSSSSSSHSSSRSPDRRVAVVARPEPVGGHRER